MEYYIPLMALHVFSAIVWAMGLLYLPRLFVYHGRYAVGSAESELLKGMEAELYRWVMNPALGAVWVFGICMVVVNPSLMKAGWFHGKLTLIVLLTGVHFWLGGLYRAYRKDGPRRSEGFHRTLNLLPLFLVALIVVLAVLKPF